MGVSVSRTSTCSTMTFITVRTRLKVAMAP
jgi:hypothetical protein